MNVITRFAPSPTGYIHIGNVRSAIYPYLVAKQAGGKMILRIEDTDRERFVEGATELIEDTLEWLGLNWDEGPIVGGPHSPYFQSERKEIYHQYARKLIELGRAYADPTERVEEYRKQCAMEKKPFLYRNFRPDTTMEWRPGIPLRFKTEPKSYTWHDEVMGDMHTGPEVLDDIILIKKDGSGCIVDYEGVGSTFKSVSDEVHIDLHERSKDEEGKKTIHIIPSAELTCTVSEILDETPHKSMKVKDFFNKYNYNDRCARNFEGIIPYIEG